MGESRVSALVEARRSGPHWIPKPVSSRPIVAPERQLETNCLVCTLQPSSRKNRWDVHYVRRYDGDPQQAPSSFEDTVDALEDSELVLLNSNAELIGEDRAPPCQVRLYRGQDALYRIDGALCRHVAEAHRLFGKRWAPYSWLGVMNRYFTSELTLEVRCEYSDRLTQAFASETDLGSGATGPLALHLSEPGRVVVVYKDCAPRTLVRIHWPMETD